MSELEVPVVIVGAGPVDMSLAADLAWRGVRCVVIERGNGSAPSPRTNVIAARSMEHFRRLGLAQRVREVGVPDDYPPDVVLRPRFCGPDLARDRWPTPRELRTGGHDEERWPIPELPRVNQRFFQPVLMSHLLANEHVDVMLESEVVGINSRGEQTRVEVSTQGTRQSLSCHHLVGCDGAHSLVRKSIGVALCGAEDLTRRL